MKELLLNGFSSDIWLLECMLDLVLLVFSFIGIPNMIGLIMDIKSFHLNNYLIGVTVKIGLISP